MGYDDVTSYIGEFGRYQRRIYFLLCLPAITCAFHKMSGVFLAAKPDFRCLLPGEDSENATFLLPPDIGYLSNPLQWSKCQRYHLNNFTDRYSASGRNLSWSPSDVKCDSFVYDTRQYAMTVTTEWDLVCDSAWLRATSDSLAMVGMMLGSLIFGALSDRYGRKLTLFSSLVGQLICGILVAVSPDVTSFLIFRLILAFTFTGAYLVSYVFALEIVGPKRRLLASTGHQISYTAGYMLTAGLAYYITSWRRLQMALTIPSIVFLGYWWFIPESTRWLLKEGRLEEVKDLLQKASLENGVELSKDALDTSLLDDSGIKLDSKKSSLLDLIRYPNLRKKCLLLICIWLVNSGTYYGLSWNTSNLGGNNYVNFAIAAAVEVPAHLFQFFTLDRWGRKINVCGCMLMAGTSLLCTLIIPDDMQWLVIVLAMFGKFAITASYGAVYIFAAEQFPTAVRNVGLGACSTSARLGGVVAPYINQLADVWTPLPLVIFGSSALIGGLVSLLLPETLNTNLPESIEDGERMGKKVDQEMKIFSEVADTNQPLTAPENNLIEKHNE